MAQTTKSPGNNRHSRDDTRPQTRPLRHTLVTPHALSQSPVVTQPALPPFTRSRLSRHLRMITQALRGLAFSSSGTSGFTPHGLPSAANAQSVTPACCQQDLSPLSVPSPGSGGTSGPPQPPSSAPSAVPCDNWSFSVPALFWSFAPRLSHS